MARNQPVDSIAITRLTQRLDVLSIALLALARAVPAGKQASVREDLQRDVGRWLSGASLSSGSDAAIAAELSALLAAVGPEGESVTAEDPGRHIFGFGPKNCPCTVCATQNGRVGPRKSSISH